MKKKFSLFMVAMIGVLLTVPVYATDIHCAIVPDVAIDSKIVDTVHTIILLIQIVVPILLVIFGMLDLAKGVMAQKEDEIKKGQQTFIKRLIAAAIVFFVITIVKMLISFVADGTSDTSVYGCVKCFLNGSSDSACQKS